MKLPTGCCLSYCRNNHLHTRKKNQFIDSQRIPNQGNPSKNLLKKDAVPSLSFGGNEESGSEN
ncbi:hypothetical protein NQ317_001829 [Molorchus minor]|uniref:Uncharacterized protein n=1 Tax=Molorchus minor TaxID=1323400 RepID=A0ABQ9JB64_9CUCU|nr:hypothetical protein NQ317_001829 [Molorchus minor]